MKLASLTLLAGWIAVAAAQTQEAPALLQKYSCYICHANDETVTGPPYVAMAAKYRGNPEAVSIVAATVKKGAHGSGPWHMPPSPQVSAADARKIAEYILALQP
jgi:cytochrome c